MQLTIQTRVFKVAVDAVEAFDIPKCWWFSVEPGEQADPATYKINDKTNLGAALTGNRTFPPVAAYDAKYVSRLEMFGGARGASFTITWAAT